MPEISPQQPGATVSLVVPIGPDDDAAALRDRVEALRRGQSLQWLPVIDAGAPALTPADWMETVPWPQEAARPAATLAGLHAAAGDFLVVWLPDSGAALEDLGELLTALDGEPRMALAAPAGGGGHRITRALMRLMARPVARVGEPATGFFAMRREDLQQGRPFAPTGPALALEFLVRCGLRPHREVPMESVTPRGVPLGELMRYVQHLRRLYIHRYGTWSHLVQFAAVGASGVFVNLGVLTLLVWTGVQEKPAFALAIAVSMVTNFLLNRRFSFSYARHGSFWRQFVGFMAACSIGAGVQFVVAVQSRSLLPELPVQVAALIGIIAGMLFNFAINRYLVFRHEHPRGADGS